MLPRPRGARVHGAQPADRQHGTAPSGGARVSHPPAELGRTAVRAARARRRRDQRRRSALPGAQLAASANACARSREQGYRLSARANEPAPTAGGAGRAHATWRRWRERSTYAGIDTTGEIIGFYPRLPAALRGQGLRHRADWYSLQIDRKRFLLTLDPDGRGPVTVKVQGRRMRLASGDTREFRLSHRAGGPRARIALRRRWHRWWQVAGRASDGRAPDAWPR